VWFRSYNVPQSINFKNELEVIEDHSAFPGCVKRCICKFVRRYCLLHSWRASVEVKLKWFKSVHCVKVNYTQSFSMNRDCTYSVFITGVPNRVYSYPQGVRDWTSRGTKILGSQSSLYISYRAIYISKFFGGY